MVWDDASRSFSQSVGTAEKHRRDRREDVGDRKIRIEKDGRVSKFGIVKPSGNVAVDESVAAIAQRVTQVDPLPEGLTPKTYYEVKIDFELNAEK